MDYNAILTPYAKDTIINVVIEIPMGSAHKVEYDRKRKIMVLDRVEPAIFAVIDRPTGATHVRP
ncbi:MAG: hypothetical protein RDU30_18005 [Desulfovibrionaceae bacterium]|nr:hypothetical protein [Desulfovibrionaceae bacterium]